MHDIPEVKLINDQGGHQQECQFLLKEDRKKERTKKVSCIHVVVMLTPIVQAQEN